MTDGQAFLPDERVVGFGESRGGDLSVSAMLVAFDGDHIASKEGQHLVCKKGRGPEDVFKVGHVRTVQTAAALHIASGLLKRFRFAVIIWIASSSAT